MLGLFRSPSQDMYTQNRVGSNPAGQQHEHDSRDEDGAVAASQTTNEERTDAERLKTLEERFELLVSRLESHLGAIPTGTP